MKFIKPVWTNILFSLIAVASVIGIILTMLNRKRASTGYSSAR
jgi:hypothetical protein